MRLKFVSKINLSIVFCQSALFSEINFFLILHKYPKVPIRKQISEFGEEGSRFKKVLQFSAIHKYFSILTRSGNTPQVTLPKM